MQGAVYRDPPQGSISLVLGAGNQAAVGATDILNELFVKSAVVICKMNPVNEYLGPYFRSGPLLCVLLFGVSLCSKAMGLCAPSRRDHACAPNDACAVLVLEGVFTLQSACVPLLISAACIVS